MEKSNDNKINKKEMRNFNILIVICFFTGVLLILSTYAWFYAALDVTIDFFKLTVSDESGLFVSLDGITFGSEVDISRKSIITDLKATYPNHTNQWAGNGLYGVSSTGIADSNSSRFKFFGNARLSYKIDSIDNRDYLHAKGIDESEATTTNMFLAFDLFLKNVSGSPYDDNLYFAKGTSIFSENDDFTARDGTINSTRIGVVKIGTVSKKSSVEMIQNIECNGNCKSVIYEPNSVNHSPESIERARKYNVTLVDGRYTPTFAVINEGKFLDIGCGQEGNIELDTEHFALQKTIRDFDTVMFPISNGITKVRVYIWVEGQDMDSIESRTEGTPIKIILNLYKDLAGYF